MEKEYKITVVSLGLVVIVLSVRTSDERYEYPTLCTTCIVLS